jgi:hypothetical protein
MLVATSHCSQVENIFNYETSPCISVLTSSAMLCYSYENMCIHDQNHVCKFEVLTEISMNRIHVTHSQGPVHQNA